ncbi:hypothetical protein H6F42_01315 [Pseudanabaena sp. FACHB-1998]|uniref:ImmA/IrrE family metallo-endopeptidase n=1 Tax=Pseudanabaena sp. FACHB-1998 TaxID=2692858 RepID=UPI001680EC9F|nr:hypothetical protein [Pseudanabaena sp. FACHB-1998]MBD2175555.1 hypothetical protein [Pseudanabaena sp. FACHB-1998]
MLSPNFEWLISGYDSPEIQQTMGKFTLRAGGVNLTQNENIWTQKIDDSVLVSAYPMAMWIASSWWRLLFEPLPPTGNKPSVDWRMAHELTAANQGFIWPRVIFASDTESIQLWSTSSNAADKQSVRYINSLDFPVSVNFLEFDHIAETFIDSVISRLNATSVYDTSLSNLWEEVKEERSDINATNYRRCEAELGFDPDECPEAIVQSALNLGKRMGMKTLSELAPTCGKDSKEEPLSAITDLISDSSGLRGKPNILLDHSFDQEIPNAPWQRANDLAIRTREAIDIGEEPMSNGKLCELLGLQESEYEHWNPPNRQHISVAVPLDNGELHFHPRKPHPTAKRFELARLLGDYLLYGNKGTSWLASTDLRTSRQKYQRAFAAEFLCPLSSLQAYLDNDYSQSAIENASAHFNVSEKTVESILVNNNLISSSYLDVGLPY